MRLYDPKKSGEYKFRLCLSLAVSAFIAFASWRTGKSSPAFWEVLLLGFGFCFFSVIHSVWALKQISSQSKTKNIKD